MPKRRSEQCEPPADGDENTAVSPSSGCIRNLYSFLRDVRAAWRDPTVPAATPVLSEYPIRRP
jgi:hypothetical protein